MRLMSASGTGSGLRRRMARVVWMISKSSVPATMKIPLLLRIGFRPATEKYHSRNDAERPVCQMGGVLRRNGRATGGRGWRCEPVLTTLVDTLRSQETWNQWYQVGGATESEHASKIIKFAFHPGAWVVSVSAASAGIRERLHPPLQFSSPDP